MPDAILAALVVLALIAGGGWFVWWLTDPTGDIPASLSGPAAVPAPPPMPGGCVACGGPLVESGQAQAVAYSRRTHFSAVPLGHTAITQRFRCESCGTTQQLVRDAEAKGRKGQWQLL